MKKFDVKSFAAGGFLGGLGVAKAIWGTGG